MRQQSLRVFGIVIAAIILLLETEWEPCARQLRLLEGWTARGTFYAFSALLTLQIARSAGTDDYDRSVNLYSNIAGASLLVCGGVYFIGGVLCIGQIKKGTVAGNVDCDHEISHWGSGLLALRIEMKPVEKCFLCCLIRLVWL